jgi:2,3-bisphosphoglycerate-independent phosphoglycerate mutase
MTVVPDDLVERSGGRIVLVVLDGLGGLPDQSGRTELEAAATPNLDRIARTASLGLHQPAGPGITPGSGPGHLALFGYDPIEYNIGRGVLSALGVGFDLKEGDLATRLNFATVDAAGRITDRRAGRPSDEENKRLVRKLQDQVKAPEGVEVFFAPEKEHRLVLIVRGKNIGAELADTDPQETGVPPLPGACTR